MSDPFVHLHTHCEYSFLDGFGHPSDFVSRAKELGQPALAITDHGNVSAHKKWNDACIKEGIKPLLGLEAYVTNDVKKKDKNRWHITLLAKNIEGYRNLLKLVSLSWEHGFYYKPRIDWEWLKQYGKGIIATSGCPSGRLLRGVIKEAWTDAMVSTELRRQAALFDDYYVELSPWAYPEAIDGARRLYAAARKEGLPIVLTMDAHYPRPADAKSQDIMLCIQNNSQFNDPNRMRFSQDDFCLHSGADMAEKWHRLHGKAAPLLEEMLSNTLAVADKVDVPFPKATPLEFRCEGDKLTFLRKLCEDGLVTRGLEGRPGYRDRLEYEFGLIQSKNFTDYFLVVSDLMRWAKSQEIVVGAARGSSCGSLMCYLTYITDVDPLQFGLLFERFIDVSRADPPDIDLDFESERRHEVKTYLEGKYGRDNVANLPTFATFKGRLCLQDVGRVFADKIPAEVIDTTKKLIVQRSSADSRAGFTVLDTLTGFEQVADWLKQYPELNVATQLEGQVRQLGIHAAGVVLSNEPIGNFAATYVTKNGDRVMSLDYYDANSVGLLKIDILGLTALTIVKRTLALIKERHGVAVDLGKLPLDDKSVYDAFQRQWLEGIFQFEGLSTRQVCRQVKPENFDQLTAVNALSRPGPLHSGGTTSFIARRHGHEPATPLHPMLEPITRSTYGIMVYQEQVMQTVRIMGKFDWSGIATVRKMMSKKWGNEAFEAMRNRFVAGAQTQGVDKEAALNVWAGVCTFGSWAFNQSHSVAYTIMAYRMMWLKVHYPAEYYASAISCEGDADKQREVLREAKASNLPVAPVCINASVPGLVGVDGAGLRLGLDAVVGVATAVKTDVLNKRPFRSYVDFTSRCKVSKKQSDILLRVGAFRDLEFTVVDAQQDLFGAHLAKRDNFDYQAPRDEDVLAMCPLAADDRVCAEWREWLTEQLGGETVMTVRDLESVAEKQSVLMLGRTNPQSRFNLKNRMEETASRGKEWQCKEGEEDLVKRDYDFLNLDVDDGTSSVIVRVSYKLYPRFKDMLWKLTPDQVLGVRGMYNGIMWMVFAFQVVNLTQLKQKLASNTKLTADEQKFLKPERQGDRRPQTAAGWLY